MLLNYIQKLTFQNHILKHIIFSLSRPQYEHFYFLTRPFSSPIIRVLPVLLVVMLFALDTLNDLEEAHLARSYGSSLCWMSHSRVPTLFCLSAFNNHLLAGPQHPQKVKTRTFSLFQDHFLFWSLGLSPVGKILFQLCNIIKKIS